MDKECKKLLGNVPEGMTPSKIRDIANRCEADWTAREVIQQFTSSWGYRSMPKPKQLEEHEEAPAEPNCYSDGSLKNPIGNHWAVGGIGVWWPTRSEEGEPLNKEEETYMEYEWSEGGCMQWAAFNELRNSSTRCEAGGARMAIQKDGPARWHR